MKTIYMIRNEQGLFSSGGMRPSFSKKGKVWHNSGALRSHITQSAGSYPKDQKIDIVEIEITEVPKKVWSLQQEIERVELRKKLDKEYGNGLSDLIEKIDFETFPWILVIKNKDYDKSARESVKKTIRKHFTVKNSKRVKGGWLHYFVAVHKDFKDLILKFRLSCASNIELKILNPDSLEVIKLDELEIRHENPTNSVPASSTVNDSSSQN